MDLSSLLNTQNESSLALSDLEQLLSKRDSALTLNKIRTTTTYMYPSKEHETFKYFDTFIQLILSIDQDDDPYNKQYSKTIIIDALRNCINGLLKQKGHMWLLQFPRQFTTKTWIELRKSLTILVYLYGLVLALLNKPGISDDSTEWLQGILPFIKSNSPVVMTHLWLNCCCTLVEEEENPILNQTIAKEAYLKALEKGFNPLNRNESKDAMEDELDQHKVPSFKGMLTILKECNIGLLASNVDQQLGSALARPPFSKDESTLGCMYMELACETKPVRFISTTKIYNNFKTTLSKINSIASPRNDDTISNGNPLLSQALLANCPSDIYQQAEAIRQGTLFWIQQMSELAPQEFDMHLKNAIEAHYPTDRKTVFDLVLADWTARDRFHRHIDLVVHALLSSTSKKYNKRASPYYAFTRLFNIPDENYQRYQLQQQQRQTDVSMLNTSSSSYQMKSGAYIDLSRFNNCSDMVLMHGCCALLQSMTLYPGGNKVEEWVADCLQSACSEIIIQYTNWLATGLERELTLQQTPSKYVQYMQVMLKNCISLSSYVVPILLNSFTGNTLAWLLKQNPQTATIILHYFDDGQQVSKDMVVIELLKTKEKDYIFMLMNYLRENMSCTDPSLPRSRAWFRNHFLGNILSLVGEDGDGQSVASCIFRQLFRTRDDFEWYFGTSLVPAQQITFKTLHLANSHDIYTVKNTGLAAMLESIARMKENTKKERLINIWLDLWTSSNHNESKFTVPVSWILQCAGLYDQAPVVVKLMIKRFIHIGISQQQQSNTQVQDIMRLAPERKFLDRIVDLILLSDAPEPDRLFEFVLSISYQQYGSSNTLSDINSAIISMMIELESELKLENLALSSTNQMPPPPPKVFKRKRGGKFHKKSRRQQAAMIRKHEEELEKYLKETNENVIKINNSMKALTTLTQRIFNFLVLLLSNTSSLSTVESTSNALPLKELVQLELTSTLLLYYPLAKLVKLIREPEDLQEDIQTVIDLCLERLKNHPTNKALYVQAQKILSNM